MVDDIGFEQSVPTPLTKEKLLLVEGRDDEGLFGALFAHLGGMPEIEIRRYEGKDKFRSYIHTLKMVRGFSAVTSIGIIRDADENAAGAFQSVRDSLATGVTQGLCCLYEVPNRDDIGADLCQR